MYVRCDYELTAKTPARIVVSSFHDPLYPDQIAIVGPNGKTISEYWHSGHLEHLALADLDGDGNRRSLLRELAMDIAKRRWWCLIPTGFLALRLKWRGLRFKSMAWVRRRSGFAWCFLGAI